MFSAPLRSRCAALRACSSELRGAPLTTLTLYRFGSDGNGFLKIRRTIGTALWYAETVRWVVFIVGLCLAWAPAAAADDPGDPYPNLVTRPAWVLNLGVTLNLTEGNSSTRLFGAVLNTNREGPVNFFNGTANGQYGTTRTPSRRPNPEGATEAERDGAPGVWKFDENINNFLVQAKYGHYFSRHRQTNYGYGLQRFEGNHFAGYWQRYETQVGYGRRLWLGDYLTLRVETGPDFTEDHQTVNRIRSRMALAATALIALKLGESSTLNKELTHLRTVATNDPETPWRDHRTRSTSALMLGITERFHLQTALQFDYASRPAPGAHPLDVRFSNAFLYAFP